MSFEWLWRLVHEPARLWRRYLVEDIAALPVLAAMAIKRLLGQPLTDLDPIDIGSSPMRLQPAPVGPVPPMRTTSPLPDEEPLDAIAS